MSREEAIRIAREAVTIFTPPYGENCRLSIGRFMFLYGGPDHCDYNDTKLLWRNINDRPHCDGCDPDNESRTEAA